MEIRRIHDGEGDEAGRLWDRMCAEMPDGGPLTPEGVRRISRMLDICAWHRDAFCLVAVDDGRIIGFVNGRVGADEGLLPGAVGEIDSLYVVPERRGEGTSRSLAQAAVRRTLEAGAHGVRYLSCADAEDDHRFWRSLGFEPDMLCMSLYAANRRSG